MMPNKLSIYFVADMVVADIGFPCGRYGFLPWPISSCCGRYGCGQYGRAPKLLTIYDNATITITGKSLDDLPNYFFSLILSVVFSIHT